ncbi:MAG: CaiB/BaiF CoA transferase family protein [Hyphomicrobiaceae bacterium]
MTQAFAGIRVLDFSQVIAGPFAAQLFNMLGADVIKVEQPDGGDQMRGFLQIEEPKHPKMSPSFMTFNAGKRSVAINLKADDAHEIILRLAKTSDVLVENFRAGVIKRLGFGYDVIREIRPDIIYCSISGYGQSGPRSGEPAYDGAIQAASGMMACTGHPETGPTRANYTPVDISTGLTAAFAIASALYRRQVTGEGQFIDVAMLDTAISLQAIHYASFLAGGPPAGLMGNGSPLGMPTADSFATKDGQILVLAPTEQQAKAFLHGIGLGDLFIKPGFDDRNGLIANRAAVHEKIAARLQTKTSDAWLEQLAEAGVAVSKVRPIPDVCKDPQLETRSILTEVAAPNTQDSSVPVVGAAFVADSDGPQLRAGPPELGQQTHLVLRELGYSDEQIARLRLT